MLPDWLFKWGVRGMGQWPVEKEGLLARVLLGNELPFFVEGLYEETFVWG
jgi:hypothetical protein